MAPAMSSHLYENPEDPFEMVSTPFSELGAFANSFGDMQVLGIKLHRPPPNPTHPRACHIGVDVMHSNLFWSDGGRHQLRGLATNVGKGKDSEARQRKAIEGYAKSAGMVIVDWFYDAAVRGADTITERPGFAAMLDRIASNGVRTIIVENPGRFART
jgi:hypothetical protein